MERIIMLLRINTHLFRGIFAADRIAVFISAHRATCGRGDNVDGCGHLATAWLPEMGDYPRTVLLRSVRRVRTAGIKPR